MRCRPTVLFRRPWSGAFVQLRSVPLKQIRWPSRASEAGVGSKQERRESKRRLREFALLTSDFQHCATMEPSLWWLILCVVLLVSSWVVYLCKPRLLQSTTRS